MSHRTVAEFDHDKAQEITDDPNRFVEAVLELLQAGSDGPGVAEKLAEFGVRVTPTCDASEERRVHLGVHSAIRL